MKLLVSRPDKIGDVVLALHAVKQLKKLKPEYEIYLHVSAYTAPLVERVKFLDGYVLYGDEVEPHRFDAVVDLIAKPYTSLEYQRAGIPLRVGNSARWFSFRYNRFAYVRRSAALINEAEYNWRLLSTLDSSLRNIRLVESLQPEDLSDLPPSPEPSVRTVLMPGAAASAKPWPVSRWLSLAQELSEQGHGPIALVGGPAERSYQEELEKGAETLEGVEVYFFERLELVIALLGSAEKYVGCSTGISHLAAVMGCEGVLLYPGMISMHPRRWAPFRTRMIPLFPIESVQPSEVAEILNEKPLPKPPGREAISAFVICKDEEEHIENCLDSISWCDELILIDSGSTDRTLEIVREKFPKAKVIEKDWPGHRAQKQFGLGVCSHPWILNIDADEEVSGELKGEILRVLERDRGTPVRESGFKICRVVRFLGRWWDKGGWYPEYRLRLLRNGHAAWGGVDPHEKAEVNGPVRRLRGKLYHYSFRDFTDYLATLNRFSSLSAAAMLREGRRPSLNQILLRPLFRFFKFYFLKRGFREGRAGFAVAKAESFYAYLKYVKLWELSLDLKNGAGEPDAERLEEGTDREVQPDRRLTASLIKGPSEIEANRTDRGKVAEADAG